MPEEFEVKLDELRKKHPSQLTEADLAFLNARRLYLQPHELIAFGMAEPEQPKEKELKPKVKPSKGLTKVQLQEALNAKGIAFDEDATKLQLAALLDGETEEEEEKEDQIIPE